MKVTQAGDSFVISKNLKLKSEKINFAKGEYCHWNPNLWIELMKSTDHKAIIQAKTTLANGKGIQYDHEGNEEAKTFFDEYIQAATSLLISDQVIFGGHLIRCMFSKTTRLTAKTIDQMYHQDIATMRIMLYTDYANEIELRSNWAANIKNIVSKRLLIVNPYPKPTKIDFKGTEGLYYSYNKSAENVDYPLPTYSSAEPYLKTAIHHGQFNLKIVENGYFPSMIIQIPNMPRQYDEVNYPRDKGVENPTYVELMKKIKAFWTGTENAGKAIVMSLENEQSIVLTKLEISNNVDLFTNQDKLTIQKTLTSHLWSPILAAFSGAGTMQGNAGEMSVSISLAENMVIYPIQKAVLDSLNNILKFNNFPYQKNNLFFPSLVPAQFKYGSDILLKIDTINELRSIIGQAPRFDGDVYAESSGIKAYTTPITQAAINEALSDYEPIQHNNDFLTSIGAIVMQRKS